MNNCRLSRPHRYLLVGAAATALQFIILQLAVLIGEKPLIGSILGYALSAILNYYVNRKWTFGYSGSHAVAIAKFTIIAGLGLLANTIVFYYTVMHMHYILAQIFSTISAIAINYTGNAYWTFTRSAPKN